MHVIVLANHTNWVFATGFEHGLLTAVSLASIFLSQWLTSVIVLLFITLWKQEDNEATMEEIEEFTLEPVLCLQHKNVDLNKTFEHLQIAVLKQQVSTLQKQLSEAQQEIKKLKDENKKFQIIKVRGNMLIENFRKTTEEFFSSRNISVETSSGNISEDRETHLEIAVQTSIQNDLTCNHNISALEEQTYTNKVIVNDITGYKTLAHDHFVCINDGRVLFDNFNKESDTKVVFQMDPEGRVVQSTKNKREGKYLENIYKMVLDQQDPYQSESDNESIGDVINREDLQAFRRKLNEFCKLIPVIEMSSSSNLSTTTTSGAENFETTSEASSSAAADIEFLFQNDEKQSESEASGSTVTKEPIHGFEQCSQTGRLLGADEMKCDSSECLTPVRRHSSEEISVMKVWNTCIQY